MRRIMSDASWSATSAGLLITFVGFASSFAILAKGLSTVGANPAQVASGLMAAAVAMGFCGVFLSISRREPISAAWTTPGAAFLATIPAPEGGFPVAVGAFLVAAVLVILAGLWRPLGRAVQSIPTPIAGAMLAGVLLPLCLAPFQAIQEYPAIALPIVLTWFVVGQISRVLAVPIAVVVAAILIALAFGDHANAASGLKLALTNPVFVTPEFTLTALTGIALPLFVITMASQNITGIAVLATLDWHPAPGPLFAWTGVFSAVAAPFGSPGVNLAAITAAMCAGEDCHPDRRRRYWGAVVAGIGYIALGLFAAMAVALLAIAPAVLVAAVAGLALMGAFASSLASAIGGPEEREAALVTFLITASGMTFVGIGGAFWGLLAGIAIHAIARWKKSRAIVK